MPTLQDTKPFVYPLGIDIGSTTVKIAILGQENELLFSDYERHFADIQIHKIDGRGDISRHIDPVSKKLCCRPDRNGSSL